MLSDKKFELDFYRFLFDATATVVTSSPQTSAGAELKCYHVDPVTGTFEPWVTLTGNLYDTGGVVTREFTLDSPFFSWTPADVVHAGTGDIIVQLDVNDLVLRCQQSIVTGFLEWTLEFSGIEWSVNGVVEDSIGGASYTGFALSPSQVPIIGGFVEMAAGAATTPLAPSVGDECPDLTGFNSERYGLSSVIGGYCYQENGVLVEPPVTVDVKPMVATGACSVDYQPTVSGTKANEVTLTARARAYLTSVFRERIECECPPGTINTGPEADVYDQTAGNETAGSRILVTPDWPRRWLKLQNNPSDFRVMAERSHLPEVKRRWSAICSVDGVTTTYADEETVLPDGSVFLDVVGSSTSAIEDVLALSAPCLHYRSCEVTKAVGVSVVYDPTSGKCIPPPGPDSVDPECGDSERSCYEQFSSEGIDWVDNVSGVPILDYPDGPTDIGRYKRYVDTWVNPFWSFGDRFESWPVLGSVPGYFDYWPLLGDQHLTNPALPPLKDRKTRTSVQSDPLLTTPLLGALSWRAYYGGFRLGVGNLKVDSETPPSSKALTLVSEPGWTPTDCTLVFGSDIEVTWTP